MLFLIVATVYHFFFLMIWGTILLEFFADAGRDVRVAVTVLCDELQLKGNNLA